MYTWWAPIPISQIGQMKEELHTGHKRQSHHGQIFNEASSAFFQFELGAKINHKPAFIEMIFVKQSSLIIKYLKLGAAFVLKKSAINLFGSNYMLIMMISR